MPRKGTTPPKSGAQRVREYQERKRQCAAADAIVRHRTDESLFGWFVRPPFRLTLAVGTEAYTISLLRSEAQALADRLLMEVGRAYAYDEVGPAGVELSEAQCVPPAFGLFVERLSLTLAIGPRALTTRLNRDLVKELATALLAALLTHEAVASREVAVRTERLPAPSRRWCRQQNNTDSEQRVSSRVAVAGRWKTTPPRPGASVKPSAPSLRRAPGGCSPQAARAKAGSRP